MSEKVLLKDLLFNRVKITKISREISQIYTQFQEDNFIDEIIEEFPHLELKERIYKIAKSLKKYLPNDYKISLKIIIAALPKENNPDLSDGDFGDFIYAAYGEYITQNGCDKNNLSISLEALLEVTKRFSAEYAIRCFINKFPQETLSFLQKHSNNTNYHIRRLCSEGTRPKLPWASKINISIAEPIKILDNLFYDNTRYVTRSVANHLNDISKINPELVIKTLTSWKESQQQNNQEMDYIIRHALRSLIKKGNIKALELLGINATPNIKVTNFNFLDKVKLDDDFIFSYDIIAQEDLKIIADYIIYFRNKAGILGAGKLFKIKNFSLKKGQKITLSKNHIFHSNMSTRKIHVGEHKLAIQINGKIYFEDVFAIYNHLLSEQN